MNLWEKVNCEKRNRHQAVVFRLGCFLIIIFSLWTICYLIFNKQDVPNGKLVFANPSHDDNSKKGSIEIVNGVETESDSGTEDSTPVTDNVPQIKFAKIENHTPSFERYTYISGDLVMDENGIIRVKRGVIDSKNIRYHSIEENDIDGNSITSRKIKNNSILGKDINRDTEITVAEIIADDLTGLNLAIAQSIDLGTNKISDGLFTGDWDFGSGNLTTSGTISGSFAGSFAPSGDVDMTNHIFTNVGNAGTDFTTAGGLNLAGNFNVNSGKLFVDATSGNVGIGTTSPEGILHALSTSSNQPIIFQRDSGATLIHIYNANMTDGQSSNIDFVSNTTGVSGDNKRTFATIKGIFNVHDNATRSGELSFSTSHLGVHSERVRISSNGNVGIGTTSPQASLDLNFKGPYMSFSGKISSSGTTLNFTEAADLAKCTVGSEITVGSVSALIISIDSSLTATVRDAPSPAWSNANIASVRPPTFIARALDGTAAFTVAGDANQTTLLHSLQVLSGGTGLDIREDVSITGSSDEQQLLIRGYDSQTSPVVTVQAGAASPYDIFRIENSGLTRIGYSTATSGTAKLAINGGVSINKETNAAALDVQGEAFFGDGTRTGYFTYSSGNNSTVIGSKTNNALEIRTNSVNRMWLDTSGNVGIGTTNPEYKLQVLGNVTVGNQSGIGVLSFHNDPVANSSSRYAGITKDYSSSMSFNFYSSGSITGSTADYNFYTGNRAQDLAVVIKGSGNVGIGTTSPGSTLDIQAAGASQQIKSTTGTNSAYTNYANTGGTFRIGQDKSTGGGLLTDSAAYAGVIAHIGNYPLQFGTNNSIRMTISNGGNVGIGTTAPGASLDIVRDTAATSTLSSAIVMNRTTSGTAASGLGTTLSYQIENDAGSQYVAGRISSSLTTTTSGSEFANMQFWVGNGADTAASYNGLKMTILGNGNVGIGTTSPNSKLEVYGPTSELQRITGTGGQGYITFYEGATIRTYLGYGDAGLILNNAVADSTALRAATGALHLTASNDALNGITVAPTGNVGIGTTSPNSTLSVSGNLSVGNVAAGTSGTRVLVLSNGTIPSTSPVDSIQLYSEDVSDSSELKVRDEAGNITTLSPHNFSLIPEGRSEDLAWSYYSQRGNKAVNVDMAKAVRLVEQLSGEQLIYLKNLKSGSYDESEPATETPLAIKELQEQSQNIAALQLQTTDNITTLEDLKNLVDKNSKTLEKRIGGLDDKISDISNRMETIEDQMAKVQLQNSEEGIGLIETRLGNLEIALNVAGSDVNVLGSLSVAGNVDLLSGKLTAEDIEALGTVRAKNIEAEESVKGKTIKGDNLELGEETRGKAEIEAGDKEAEIETKAVSNSSQIYITPLGKLGGGNLYVDMENIKEGKSFKVKLDGEELDSDIEFNWLIIK